MYRPLRELDIQGFSTVKIMEPLFLKFIRERIEEINSESSFHHPDFRMIRALLYSRLLPLYQNKGVKYFQCHFPIWRKGKTLRNHKYKGTPFTPLPFSSKGKEEIHCGELNLSEHLQFYHFKLACEGDEQEFKVEVPPGYLLLFLPSTPYKEVRRKEVLSIFHSISQEPMYTSPELVSIIHKQENPYPSYKLNKGMEKKKREKEEYREEEVNLMRPIKLN